MHRSLTQPARAFSWSYSTMANVQILHSCIRYRVKVLDKTQGQKSQRKASKVRQFVTAEESQDEN